MPLTHIRAFDLHVSTGYFSTKALTNVFKIPVTPIIEQHVMFYVQLIQFHLFKKKLYMHKKHLHTILESAREFGLSNNSEWSKLTFISEYKYNFDGLDGLCNYWYYMRNLPR